MAVPPRRKGWAARFVRRVGRAMVLVGCFASSLASSACYRATFMQTSVARAEETATFTHYFLFGLIGDTVIDTRAVCGSQPISDVTTGGNFTTGVLAIVTLGIYTPRIVYVGCGLRPLEAPTWGPVAPPTGPPATTPPDANPAPEDDAKPTDGADAPSGEDE
jgi:hypothetical protein